MGLFTRKKVKSDPPTPMDEKSKDESEDGTVVVTLEDQIEKLDPRYRDVIKAQVAIGEPRKAGFKDLVRFYTRNELIACAASLVLAAAAGVIQPLQPLFFGNSTTSFTNFGTAQSGSGSIADAGAQLTSTTERSVKILAGLGGVAFFTTLIYSTVFMIVAENVAHRMRVSYLRAVLRQNIGYYETQSAGAIVTRLTTDLNLVQSGIGDKVARGAQYMAQFVGGFIVAFVTSWRLSVVMLGMIPFIGVVGAVFGPLDMKFKKAQLDAQGQCGSVVEEALASIRSVKAFSMDKRLLAIFEPSNQRVELNGHKRALVVGILVATMFFVVYSVWSLALWYGSILLVGGGFTTGQVITTVFAFVLGAASRACSGLADTSQFSLGSLPESVMGLNQAFAAASGIIETIERVPVIDSASDEGLKLDSVKGELSVSDLSFIYPSRPSAVVTKNVSALFPAGKTTALVGPSGAGKSSIVQLLLRFYDPVEGLLQLDGHDINSLNLRWYRSQIGLVSQEPTLFSATVFENIAHGLVGSRFADVSDDEKQKLVEAAAVKANADSFIRSFPGGYSCKIGERGILVSGGQRQRIAIARAIVADPPILLLDEATASLDTRSEKAVQAALDAASQNRTTIAIAHRLSTIKDADQIIAMVDGEIAEVGTHTELLERDGIYKRLVDAQKFREMLPDEGEDADETDVPLATGISEDRPPINREASGMSARLAVEAAKPKEAPGRMGISVLIKRLISMNRAQWRNYLVGAIGTFVLGSIYPVFALLFGAMFGVFTNDLSTQAGRDALRSGTNFYTGFIWLLAWAAMIGMLMSQRGWRWASEFQCRVLRRDAFAAYMRTDVAFFDNEKNDAGSLTSSISDDPTKTDGLMGQTLGVILQGIVTLVAGMIIALVYAPKVAAVGIAFLPLTVTGGYVRLKVVMQRDEMNAAKYESAAGYACEAATAIRTVASLTRERDVVDTYAARLQATVPPSRKATIWGNVFYGISTAASFFAIAALFYYGSKQLQEGLSVRSFFTALSGVVFASIEAGQIIQFVPDASSFSGAANRLLRLIDSRPEIDAEDPNGSKEPIKGHLQLNSVHFRYPTRPDVRVLAGLSIECKPGEFIALCGPSGCGKSTTIAMLEQFYRPLSGSITCDGIPLEDWNLAHLRANMALVSQDVTLFKGSLKDNILLGAKDDMDIDDKAIEQACRDANIWDFVSTLPDGLNTDVGNRGLSMSGGQRQRLSIARALIRDPRILLLDEASAALDSESERIVQDALDRARKGRTTVAIAHRLSTISSADRIYVIGDGRVIESGTHSALMSKRAAYYELVTAQSLV